MLIEKICNIAIINDIDKNLNIIEKGAVIFEEDQPLSTDSYVYFNGKVEKIIGYDYTNTKYIFEDSIYSLEEYDHISTVQQGPRQIIMSTFLISSEIPLFKFPFHTNYLKIKEEVRSLVNTPLTEIEEYNKNLENIVTGYANAEKNLYSESAIKYALEYCSEHTIFDIKNILSVLKVIKQTPLSVKVKLKKENDETYSFALDSDKEPMLSFMYERKE